MAARRSARARLAAPVAAHIGVDTGGTFTDVVAWRGGERVAFKVPSTPADPAVAVATAVSTRLGLEWGFHMRDGHAQAHEHVFEHRIGFEL